ncbi:MAG: L-seryl-tRNA(Sec) selenium transferase [Nitrospirae bacterium]|nr:L-seryl-tRNA(Sec) selenium transferase [Nitrospirota bacterium]
MKTKESYLRQLPSVDELLKEAVVLKWLEEHPRALVLEALRMAIEEKRKSVLKIDEAKGLQPLAFSLQPENIINRAEEILNTLSQLNLRPVINATGVIVHTNLGRSILSEGAVKNIEAVAKGYSNLEYDIEKGERGKRYHHIEKLLCRLTGAEAGFVVNNNAAAVLIALNTLAQNKEVIVSRGELVEIGGSFRIPEVMERSNARLREVGATNKTHLKDYEKAVNDNTALLLKVHTSNYKIVGFAKEVAISELVGLGKKKNLPVMFDLGSGCLIDLRKYGIEGEPTVSEALDAGADIITFSGDKLLGGPQAGLFVGKKKYIDMIVNNPLSRAIRIDKLTLAGLEATLREYLDEEKAVKNIPTLYMLCQTLPEIEIKAVYIADGLKTASNRFEVSVIDETSQSGGGALPLVNLQTKVVAILPKGFSATAFEEMLRKNNPPIIGRIKEGRILLDPRTIQRDELDTVINSIRDIVSRLSAYL